MFWGYAGWGGAAARCRGAEGGGAAVHHINFRINLAVHIARPVSKTKKNYYYCDNAYNNVNVTIYRRLDPTS